MADIATEPRASTGTALIKLLYVARGLRGFGDGFAIIILPAYMTALGYDAIAVGIVATASLLGTALLTLITGWIAPRHDLRALLIFGAGLMAATGLAFPGVEHFVLIALVAFIGDFFLHMEKPTLIEKLDLGEKFYPALKNGVAGDILCLLVFAVLCVLLVRNARKKLEA